MNDLLNAIPWPELAWSPIPFFLGVALDRVYLHLSRNRRSHREATH